MPGFMDVRAFCSLSVEWELFSWQLLVVPEVKVPSWRARSKFKLGINRRA